MHGVVAQYTLKSSLSRSLGRSWLSFFPGEDSLCGRLQFEYLFLVLWLESELEQVRHPIVGRSVRRHAHKQRVNYPLSSCLSAEKQPLGSGAVQALTVFSFIGLGNYDFSSIVFLILLRAFKAAVFNDAHALEWVWRLQLGLGLISRSVDTVLAAYNLGNQAVSAM